jgi:hypothetical protein
VNHPIDFALDALPEHKVQLMLEPMLCIDCEQYVPLGWVVFGLTKCPKATSHYPGHRALTEAITKVKDRLYNTLAEAGLLPKRGSVQIVRLDGTRGYGYILFNAITGEIVEATSVSVYPTRAEAVSESRNRLRALGFESVTDADPKTTVFQSVQAFNQRVSVTVKEGN